MSAPFTIAKLDADRRLVFGWASVSMDHAGEPLLDSQGDVISPAVLESAAYSFTKNNRGAGERHERTGVGRVVESLYLDEDKASALGVSFAGAPRAAWWIGLELDDDVFARVKAGEYSMLSIGGSARGEHVA